MSLLKFSETVASKIGADQEKIDECIDDDDEVEIKLIKLIFETNDGFLFWEHTPEPEKKKQKVSSGPKDGDGQVGQQGIDLTGDEQGQDPTPKQQADPKNLQELLRFVTLVLLVSQSAVGMNPTR